MKKVSKVISVPIAAQLAILPVMIINFNTISLTFLISNILAIPILGISIIGGYLLAFLSLIWLWGAKKLAIILDIFLEILILIAKFCANLKLSNIYVTTPNAITIIIYYIILFIGIYFFECYLNIITNAKTVARRGYTFFGLNTWRKKMSNSTRLGGILRNTVNIVIIILAIVIILEIPYGNYNGKLKIYFIDVGQRR